MGKIFNIQLTLAMLVRHPFHFFTMGSVPFPLHERYSSINSEEHFVRLVALYNSIRENGKTGLSLLFASICFPQSI